MWAILSIRVENKPGILFKVTHLFRARNFNIDSISVGVMENPEFSKMIITTVGTEKQIAQIVKQLDKIIDRAKASISEEFSPISDVRASKKYRTMVAMNLLEKAMIEMKQKQMVETNVRN